METGRRTGHTPPLYVRPGSELPIEIQLQPRSKTKINEIDITINCKEIVKYRTRKFDYDDGGTDSDLETEINVIWSSETVPEEYQNTTLPPGKAVTISPSVVIPEDAPTSFEAPYNQVFWQAFVRIDVDMWPDWSHRAKFGVTASGAPAETKPRWYNPLS